MDHRKACGGVQRPEGSARWTRSRAPSDRVRRSHQSLPRSAGRRSTAELERRLAEEIVWLQRLIDTLGEELVEDP